MMRNCSKSIIIHEKEFIIKIESIAVKYNPEMTQMKKNIILSPKLDQRFASVIKFRDNKRR